MASVYKEIAIHAPMENVWAAVRDVGAVHKRLAIGFVTDCRLDGDTRIVTFANGMVARERIVGIDQATRRVAYAAVGGGLTHHNASMQVRADGEDRTRLVWITDVLPNEIAGLIGEMMEQGAAAVKQSLERRDTAS